MILVSIESPFAGDVETNQRYARACMRDSIQRGEAPIASHLLYTQPGILDDQKPEERKLGMACGFAWNRMAHMTVVYTDLGVTKGMQEGMDRADRDGRQVLIRMLGQIWTEAEKVNPCNRCGRPTRQAPGFGYVCDPCWDAAHQGHGATLVPEAHDRRVGSLFPPNEPQDLGMFNCQGKYIYPGNPSGQIEDDGVDGKKILCFNGDPHSVPNVLGKCMRCGRVVSEPGSQV